MYHQRRGRAWIARFIAAGESAGCGPADAERADLELVRRELAAAPTTDRTELARIYETRGVTRDLALQVAEQLMAHDALDAHARDELGSHDLTRARPIQAAMTSAASFAVGATPPTLLAALLSDRRLTPGVVVVTPRRQVSSVMSERRYTDEEVAAIFKLATETDRAVSPLPAEGGGATLGALQEIGREVGISPEAISQAARSLERAGKPARRTLLGFPIGVGRTVEFDRPLTDAEWERLVADLRDTFNARGRVQYDGPFRQWTNGNLQALVEPTPGGHRLRIQTMNGFSRRLMTGGIVVLGLSAATWVSATLAGSLGHPGTMAEIGSLAATGVGIFAGGALRLPMWARRRRAQIDAITARLTHGVAKAAGSDPAIAPPRSP